MNSDEIILIIILFMLLFCCLFFFFKNYKYNLMNDICAKSKSGWKLMIFPPE